MAIVKTVEGKMKSDFILKNDDINEDFLKSVGEFLLLEVEGSIRLYLKEKDVSFAGLDPYYINRSKICQYILRRVFPLSEVVK